MYDNFFTTGEFAKLCGVKRDTLLHYDKIGLLKPEIVGENGYRYYGTSLSMTFDIISTLKEVGTPLSQIMDYLGKQDSNSFLAVLKSKRTELESEMRKLNKMQRILNETISITEQGISAECDVISFEECGEEYLIVFDATEIDEPESHGTVNIRNHITDFRQKDYGYEFPMGGIVLSENVQKGNFRETLFYSKANRKTDDERMLIKPAGTYATMYHRGSYDDLIYVFPNFMRMAEELGYVVRGHLYQEDRLYFLSEWDERKTVVKISARADRDRVGIWDGKHESKQVVSK
jgi:DNA-binding transcriptional MerR regulator/effector-binding domain-containing protein